MPEGAPPYRVPGPRALTPQERAFRRWMHEEGAQKLAAMAKDPGEACRLMDAALIGHAAGWEAGRNVG